MLNNRFQMEEVRVDGPSRVDEPNQKSELIIEDHSSFPFCYFPSALPSLNTYIHIFAFYIDIHNL